MSLAISEQSPKPYELLVQWCKDHRNDKRFPALYAGGHHPTLYAIVDINQKQGTPGYIIAKGDSWEEVYARIQEIGD